MSIIEPFIPEGINPNNNYTFTCIDRVNSNYKIALTNNITFNDAHYLKSFIGDDAVSYATNTTFNNNVGIGTSTIIPSALLNIYSKVVIDNTSASPPVNGITGGTGTRLILSQGSASTTPMSIGCNTYNLWINVPSTNSIFFYCGLTEQLIINSTTITALNITSFRINNSILDLGSGTNTTPIYLNSSGNSLLGVNNTVNQFASSSAIGDTILRSSDAKKLILQSGSTNSGIIILDSGNVGIKTTPTAPLDINGNIKIITTNSLPLISQNGTSGDRIILKEGVVGTNTYPISIGCSGDKLWFNVPTASEHFFYINGVKTLSIRPDAIDISITDVLNMGLWLSQSGGSLLGCSSLNTQYSLSALVGDTVLKSKIGNKLILQSGNDYAALIIDSNNRVGIGSTSPSNIFQVGNGGRLRIANDTTDYSLIGTKDIDDVNNTHITLNGNTKATLPGTIEYTSTSTGNHLFFTGGNTERMRINSSGYVGIGTTDPRTLLTINSVPLITNAHDFSVVPAVITNITPTSTTTLNDPKSVLYLCREGTVGQAYASRATFSLCRWENNANNSRTRLDIGLSHSQFDNVNIMSLRSDGAVSIGTTTPQSTNTKLTISGSSSGYSQPLVQITQSNPTWNGNYALQVDGYTLLGGFRINANDGANSIYQTLANKDIGIAQFPNATNTGNIATTTFGTGVIKFFTNGNNERMIINSSGNIGIGTTDPGTNKLYVNGDTLIDGVLYVNTSKHIQLGSTNGNNIAIATAPNQFSTSAATGDMVIRSSQKLLLQSGTGNSAISIGTNNYLGLGIGSTTANFPITLYSTSSTAQSMTSYAIAGISIYNGNQSTPINPTITVGIMSQAAFNSAFYVYSDQRIKKDITPLENSLDIIDKINTVSFKYIDFIEKGTIKNYGVIAQEIEKIIPEVINSHKDYIPNIYKNADKYDNELLRLYIKTDDLSIGDDIKIYDMKNKHHLKKIVDKTDEYITINEPIEDYEEDTSVFIYGKEIEDVKNVNYESLFIMNIKATQELHQRLKTLEDIIKNLINR